MLLHPTLLSPARSGKHQHKKPRLWLDAASNSANTQEDLKPDLAASARLHLSASTAAVHSAGDEQHLTTDIIGQKQSGGEAAEEPDCVLITQPSMDSWQKQTWRQLIKLANLRIINTPEPERTADRVQWLEGSKPLASPGVCRWSHQLRLPSQADRESGRGHCPHYAVGKPVGALWFGTWFRREHIEHLQLRELKQQLKCK